MIDIPALNLMNSGGVSPESYECGEKRCILSEALIRQLIHIFQQNIRTDIIDLQVGNFFQSLTGEADFAIIRY
jgi:hypothetical protein